MTVLCQKITIFNQFPDPATKAASKPASEGKHGQLFTIRSNVGQGFYLTADDLPDGH